MHIQEKLLKHQIYQNKSITISYMNTCLISSSENCSNGLKPLFVPALFICRRMEIQMEYLSNWENITNHDTLNTTGTRG
jgi:hypothetical protein